MENLTFIGIPVAHYCSWATVDMTVLHQYQTWHTDHSVTGLHEINNPCRCQLCSSCIYTSVWSLHLYVSLDYITINSYWYPGRSLLLLSYSRYDSPPSVSNMTYNPLCDWTSWNKQPTIGGKYAVLASILQSAVSTYMFPLTISPLTLVGILVAHYWSWATVDMTVLHRYQTWHTDHSVTGLHEINNRQLVANMQFLHL